MKSRFVLFNPHSRIVVILSGLALLSILAACLIGSTPMDLARILATLSGQGSQGDQIVVFQIRLPRALAAFVVGASLGLSGAALQGLLRNPLAEPGVLGVSATSSLAATIAIYYNFVSLSPWLLPALAIIGALVSTALLTFAALRTASIITLILFGVGLSSFAGASMSLLLNLAPTPFSLTDMINWSLGSVANRSFADIGLATPFIVLGVMLLLRARSGLRILTLGEQAASAAGLNVDKQRVLVVVGAGLVTGAAVSLAGAIGFVGLVAPHLVRPWVNYDPGDTLLPAALLGGVLLVLADVGVRLIPTAIELNLGVLAALLGAPVFVWIVLNREPDRG